MSLLVFGVSLFAFVHLMPLLFPSVKSNSVQRIGENGYKGFFSVIALAAIVLIVIGWKNAPVSYLYYFPSLPRSVAYFLNFLSITLILSSYLPTRIKTLLRHPMLSGVMLWAFTHLLFNGESRSIILFGIILIWCVIEILLLNKRDGQWEKPKAPSPISEVILIALAGVLTFVIIKLHSTLSGVPLV